MAERIARMATTAAVQVGDTYVQFTKESIEVTANQLNGKAGPAIHRTARSILYAYWQGYRRLDRAFRAGTFSNGTVLYRDPPIALVIPAWQGVEWAA